MRGKLSTSLRCGAFALAALALFQVFAPPRYDPAPPAPFTGSELRNPYSGYRGGGLRANFHAHAEAWGGLSFGEVPRHELYDLYARAGYDVVGISDYMHIGGPPAPDALFVPAYEHGWGFGRQHQTVIGASSVDWFDYLFGGSVSAKQHILERLRARGGFIVLNHPTKAESYTIDDLATLASFDAVEIATKYGIWNDFWDAALSAGRPVWGLAADDGHTQASKRSHLGIGAIVLHTAERTPEAVLAALRAGHFHSLYTRQNEAPIELLSHELEGDELVVAVGERADTIRFSSDHGVVRHEQRGGSTARYRLRPADTYVRVEVSAHGAVLFTNPVLRWDGRALPTPRASLNTLSTWTGRIFGLALLALLALLAWLLLRRSGAQREASPDVSKNAYPVSTPRISSRS